MSVRCDKKLLTMPVKEVVSDKTSTRDTLASSMAGELAETSLLVEIERTSVESAADVAGSSLCNIVACSVGSAVISAAVSWTSLLPTDSEGT